MDGALRSVTIVGRGLNDLSYLSDVAQTVSQFCQNFDDVSIQDTDSTQLISLDSATLPKNSSTSAV